MKPLKLSFLLILVVFLLNNVNAYPRKESNPSEKEIKDPYTTEQYPQTINTASPAATPATPKGQAPKLQEHTDNNQKTGIKKPFDNWITRDPIILFSGLVALFTFCLVVVGIVQAKIYGIQTRYMRISERAWIDVSFHQLYTPGGSSIDVEIFNTGKSPGHIKKTELVSFEVTERDKSIPYEPRSALPPGAGTLLSLSPGVNTTNKWVVKLEQDEIDEVVMKTKKLTICGFICYDDVFGKGHVTNFYRVWMEVDGPLKGRFMIPPDTAPGQNEAT